MIHFSLCSLSIEVTWEQLHIFLTHLKSTCSDFCNNRVGVIIYISWILKKVYSYGKKRGEIIWVKWLKITKFYFFQKCFWSDAMRRISCQFLLSFFTMMSHFQLQCLRFVASTTLCCWFAIHFFCGGSIFICRKRLKWCKLKTRY